MTNNSQHEADVRLRAFFRNAISTEPGITDEKAEQIAERCVQSIDMVLTKRASEQAARDVAAPAPAAPPPPAPQFDPFAFSAVSVLARKGRDALLERLGEIGSAGNLREFAIAQHISIDQNLTQASELRLAIVNGTERRIAARRAAAS